MVECDVCGADVKELIMGKIRGTYLKSKGGLLKVCSECQSSYSLSELKKRLGVE